MRRLRVLVTHPVAGPPLRFGLAGATVAAVYLSLPVILNGVFGVAIQVAIPIAYLLAVTLHFNLQRHFVFRHVASFALSGREQVMRYVAIGAVQYPTTALLTAVLPGALGISQRTTFVLVTLAISVTFFVILRGHVFHPAEEAEQPRRSAIALLRLRAQDDVPEPQHTRRVGPGNAQLDPVEPPVELDR